MGFDTLLATINIETIGHMPCNCSVGGPAKGHLVREIDALGGQQALATDATYTHIRMLNTGKGPAVRALRAQVDKRRYEAFMRHALMNQPRLDVKQAMVEEVVVEGTGYREQGTVRGVRTRTGIEYGAKCVIITTGTFLKGLIHIGETQFSAGRAGEFSAEKLSDSLRGLGFELGRLKTGTTPRIEKTVDFTNVSGRNRTGRRAVLIHVRQNRARWPVPCWLTYTNEHTKQVIDNLQRSDRWADHGPGRVIVHPSKTRS